MLMRYLPVVFLGKPASFAKNFNLPHVLCFYVKSNNLTKLAKNSSDSVFW
ncbi:5838_t:CDS:2 [Funneliformis geosporum]|nr:5838_t:CDS:2 [Funneliformis geosporum]